MTSLVCSVVGILVSKGVTEASPLLQREVVADCQRLGHRALKMLMQL